MRSPPGWSATRCATTRTATACLVADAVTRARRTTPAYFGIRDSGGAASSRSPAHRAITRLSDEAVSGFVASDATGLAGSPALRARPEGAAEVTVSMRVMSAGDGYKYLLKSIAAGDGGLLRL